MPGPFNPAPWPWEDQNPPAPAPAPTPDYSARDAAIQQYVDKYGVQIGQPATVQGTVHVPADAKDAKGNPDPNAGKTITADTGFKTYTFPNGVSVEISDDGQVRNEKLPSSVTGRQQQRRLDGRVELSLRRECDRAERRKGRLRPGQEPAAGPQARGSDQSGTQRSIDLDSDPRQPR